MSLPRLTALVVAITMVAVACGSADSDTPSATTDNAPTSAATAEPDVEQPEQPTPRDADTSPSTDEPASQPETSPAADEPASQPETSPAAETAPEAEEERLVAGVNVAIADVPLDSVVFDTFDGGSISLAEATETEILRLLNAIPPIDDPVYQPGVEAGWLPDDDLVLGYVDANGAAWAHPHRILNFHEIVNTNLGGQPLAITYCPLCGSGVVFDRRPEDLRHDGILTFDNTSALYENDMVMVDAETNTYWWQVAGRGIVGNLTGTELTPLPSMTTTWQSWLELHPDTMVMSNNQGFINRYERDPFSSYAASLDQGRTPFPTSPEAFADERLNPSTRVIGFELEGEPAAVAVLANAATVVPVEDTLVVFLDGRGGGALFDARIDGGTASFEPTPSGFVDSRTGSTWDAAGRAIDGPAIGSELVRVPSRTAYWFSWVSTTGATSTRLFSPAGES